MFGNDVGRSIGDARSHVWVLARFLKRAELSILALTNNNNHHFLLPHTYYSACLARIFRFELARCDSPNYRCQVRDPDSEQLQKHERIFESGVPSIAIIPSTKELKCMSTS
jgi:hypothetical protein